MKSKKATRPSGSFLGRAHLPAAVRPTDTPVPSGPVDIGGPSVINTPPKRTGKKRKKKTAKKKKKKKKSRR